MWAASGGHREVVELLVSTGANMSLADRFGINILHSASLGGDVKIVQYVLLHHRLKISGTVNCGRTAVMLAAGNGHKDVMELLVKSGANLALKDTTGHNTLHIACFEGHVDVVEYILSQHTVDIDSEGYKQRTPVILAAMAGYKGVVELLVKRGADLTLKDREGHNILYCASAVGQLEIVKYIISLGRVDVNSAGHHKRTSLMVAGYGGHKQVVEFLVNHGATLSLKDRDTNNILHLISLGRSVEVMKYHLSLNAVDINSRGWKNRTPVMIAAERGHKGLVELCRNHEADLSLTDKHGDNILHLAVSRVEVVKYILSLRVVEVNAKNRDRETAATRARALGRGDVLNLLRSYGASP